VTRKAHFIIAEFSQKHGLLDKAKLSCAKVDWLTITSKPYSQPAVLIRLAVEHISVASPHDTEQALCNNRSPMLTSLGRAALCNSLPDSPSASSS
jgi:hypothetical protein